MDQIVNGSVYRFPTIEDKKNALLILVETSLIWDGVRASGQDLLVDDNCPLNAHITQIILSNNGKKVEKVLDFYS
jgi:hypothetical protein